MSSIEPDTSKTDCIVVGAGVAGLAASIRLRAAGRSVILLERQATCGGKIRTTPSAAGPVDAGPTVLTMRHVFDDLFGLAGATLENFVTLHRQRILARHFWADGSQLDLFDNEEDNRNAIYQFAGPKAEADFIKFNKATHALFETFDEPMMQAAQPRIVELGKRALKSSATLRAMGIGRSLQDLLKHTFDDVRLRQLFGRYATYVGGSPHLSPAVLALIWQAEARGVWVVDGGMHKLAEAMRALATDMGVRIRPGSRVSEILTAAARTCGIRLEDGTKLASDVVVYAGDPRALASGLLGPQTRHVAPQTLASERSHSARVYSFAAKPNGPDLLHHNVFFDADPQSEFDDLASGKVPRNPSIYICAEDRGTDKATPDPERFEIITNAPANPGSHTPEEMTQWNTMIMMRLRKFGLTFSPEPTPETITTPSEFASLFPGSKGALYGQTPHGLMAALKRPTARTAIPGLYLCGGGTHPGAGVPMATLSARHAVEAILRDQTSASTSAQTAMHGGMSTA